MKKIFPIIILLSLFIAVCSQKQENVFNRVIVAYVTSWSDVMPDPASMTHINYAFGHVNDSFNGIRINNEERLKQICALKKEAPSLKVLLSIGGWGSGRFSEMASDEMSRKAFATDCQRVVDEFGLDGIDIDWEYPTSSMAGISSSPNDTKNFTLLMKDIRDAIGKDKLLTLASVADAKYVDFRAVDPFIDFVNIMSYDMASAPLHHSPLFRSENAGHITSEEAVIAHLNAGVPKNKLVMGMPFYGRGDSSVSDFMDYKQIEILEGYEKRWDDTAKVPYLVNAEGILICGYDDPQSLAIKCQYILDQGLLGAMYWDYSGDNEAGDLQKTIFRELKIEND